jgi:hypothetical protein
LLQCATTFTVQRLPQTLASKRGLAVLGRSGPPRCSRPFRSATAPRQVRIPRPYPRPANVRARVVARARCSSGDADSHRWGLGIGSRAATPRAATHPTHPWAAAATCHASARAPQFFTVSCLALAIRSGSSRSMLAHSSRARAHSSTSRIPLLLLFSPILLQISL